MDWEPGWDPGPELVSIVKNSAEIVACSSAPPVAAAVVPPAPVVPDVDPEPPASMTFVTLAARANVSTWNRNSSTAKYDPWTLSATGMVEYGPLAVGMAGVIDVRSTAERSAVRLILRRRPASSAVAGICLSRRSS